MDGAMALNALIETCDKVAMGAMKIEADARAGEGMTAAEVLAFISGVREMSQNVGTMLRLMKGAIDAQGGRTA